MAENPSNPIQTLIAEARARLGEEVKSQAGQLESVEKSLEGLRQDQQKLAEDFAQRVAHLSENSLRELRDRQKKLEQAIEQQLDQFARYEPPPPPPPVAPLDKLLGSVRDLITATLPEQVLEVLTQEANQLGVRAAVFDVRGKAAWGSSARGFDASLTANGFRGVVVPLNQDSPFRQVMETGGHVDTNAAGLKKNRNVVDKLKPGAEDTILLLPIRSAGSVSAIFYADSGGRGAPLPVDALKILSEFASAQLDRLMALSGGGAAEAVAQEAPDTDHEAAPAASSEAAETAPAPAPVETRERVDETVVSAQPEASAAAEPAPAPAPAPAAAFDISQLSEEDQKYHKDAKRFAKLLVSEIDLYNKTKVADGRKNSDLYKRLKSDIERSRQTYQKRFSKTVGKQIDYFHEEIVRSLAANDASLMGPDYPGPAA